ncbi:MAG: mechanosensitive ion channel domain-containing protein [Planctomycetota bacterium]|nr:mechanosensitive ion channel domain-containing protein [Planctomycetota bacterium]
MAAQTAFRRALTTVNALPAPLAAPEAAAPPLIPVTTPEPVLLAERAGGDDGAAFAAAPRSAGGRRVGARGLVVACLLLLVLAPVARGVQGGTASDSLQDLEARVQAELERAISVPSRVQLLRARGEPAPFVGSEVEADRLELEALEERAERARDDLDAARAVVQELVVDEQRRATRLAALPELIARAASQAAQAEEAATSAPVDQIEAVTRAAQEARATADLLGAERAAIEAERDLVKLQIDDARRKAAVAQAAAAFWSEQLQEREGREGTQELRLRGEELAALVEAHPLLDVHVGRELELLRRQVGAGSLSAKIGAAREEVERLKARLGVVRARRARAQTRASVGGLDAGTGARFQRFLETLESDQSLAAAEGLRAAQISRLEYEKIELEQELERLAAGEASLETIIGDVSGPARSEALTAAAREVLEGRQRALEDTRQRLQDLSDELLNQRIQAGQLRTEVQRFRTFLESLVLFVRSAAPFSFASLGRAPSDTLALVSMLSPEFSGERLEARLDRVMAAPDTPGLGRAVLLALVLLLLLAARPVLRRRLDEMGAKVRSFRTDRYGYTLRALFQTALLALPGPFALRALSQYFPEPAGAFLPDASESLLEAIQHGLADTAVLWWVLGLLRGVTAEHGLGTVHFRWPQASMAFLRRELSWFLPSFVLLEGVSAVLARQHDAPWHESVGRMTFAISMSLLSFVSYRVLRADSELWAGAARAGGGARGLLVRTRRLWALIATALPLVLVALALAGYDYTAHRFEQRLGWSWLFALGLALVNAMLVRWLFIARRRLAVSQALEAKARREEEEAAEEAGIDTAASGVFDTEKVDIPAIDAQTRQLFKSSITLASLVGIYLIWAGVLPALQAFDRVQLLPRPAIVEEISPGALALDVTSGLAQESSSTASNSVPLAPGIPFPAGELGGPDGGIPATLTLADLLLASVFVVLTSVAARNLPALLELTLLQRLPIDGGARYAISTIVRYLILIFGVSLVSGALGIGWAKIQWLAAALTFGLAFGLQEIFANFVSGLIILIERPVRVGDVVSVSGIHGRVTQLRMRATTILDWDRKEMLVPNKEFITNSVVNWTLSDPKTRVIIPVGIAYGSDTRKARDILLEVAAKSRMVVEEPAPMAIFKGFGDSTLDLELRVFTDNRDLWPNLIDELHSEIDAAFRAADIEIAFPQRDLHIRSDDTRTDA